MSINLEKARQICDSVRGQNREDGNRITHAFYDAAWDLLPATLEHIDSQARQIAALKDDLLTDRAELILYSPEFSLWRYQHHINEIRDQDDLKPITEEAQRQLAAEHPDLFREPTKMMADSEKEARP